jgi:hypothetical protein
VEASRRSKKKKGKKWDIATYLPLEFKTLPFILIMQIILLILNTLKRLDAPLHLHGKILDVTELFPTRLASLPWTR